MQTPASPDFLQATEFVDYANSPDDFFSILDALDTELLNHENNDVSRPNQGIMVESQEKRAVKTLVSQNSTSSLISADTEPEPAAAAAALATSTNNSNEMSSPKSNKRKLSNPEPEDGQQKISHITVERNRRKQMNENLTVLRSLMPSFYVKRGDQASIVGGVADYISELQQILRSLEAKKQRKLYSEVMSPRLLTSPRTTMSLPISPRKPPLSPRLISSLPASPRTPQGSQPIIINNNNSCNFPNLNMSRLMHQTAAAEATTANNFLLSPTSSCSTSSNIDNDQLVANSKSPVADVEVKFSGPNLILNVVSRRLPGQALKIILALEHLSLEILNVSLNTTEQTMIQSFTIKIGIECQLSAEELAHQIQQTFCS